MQCVIAILGVGNLGKRHLESVLNSSMSMDIFCYDINPNALDAIDLSKYSLQKQVILVTDIRELPSQIDIAILATTSNVRRRVYEELIAHAEVKNIIFEKVLFQKMEDFAIVGRSLEDNHIKAWVNCPRRQMDSYHDLKRELQDAREFQVVISGGEWGLACNLIHEIDIIEYLSGESDTQITDLNLLPSVTDSIRKGYKEVYGTVRGRSGRCTGFSIHCMKDAHVPILIMITTDTSQYVIDEGKQKIYCKKEQNAYELKEREFVIPYVSQMTKDIVADILTTGNCHLTEYADSARLHLQFIKPLLRFFESQGMEQGECPIT